MIQAAARGRAGRKRVEARLEEEIAEEDRRVAEEDRQRRELAEMRGREESLARELAGQKALVASEHERAATKVQAAARGHLGRARVLADMEVQEGRMVSTLAGREQVTAPFAPACSLRTACSWFPRPT